METEIWIRDDIFIDRKIWFKEWISVSDDDVIIHLNLN